MYMDVMSFIITDLKWGARQARFYEEVMRGHFSLIVELIDNSFSFFLIVAFCPQV